LPFSTIEVKTGINLTVNIKFHSCSLSGSDKGLLLIRTPESCPGTVWEHASSCRPQQGQGWVQRTGSTDSQDPLPGEIVF